MVCARGSVGQILLPDIGDSSETAFSSQEERDLGDALMREIRASLDVVDDPEVEDYIQSLGYKLASNSDQQTLRFRFFVVNDGTINAFAAPGGLIGANAGLITTAETESELAAVIAHEISHVTQRHIARSVELANRALLPAIAGLAAAILIGTQSAEAGQAAIAAVSAGAAQVQVNFTRANEQEADRVGMQVLSRAGFDPKAMPSFFERLQQSARYRGEPPEFLSTHPVTSSRIADSRARAERLPYREYKDNLSFHLVRAKLQVGTQETPQHAVRLFKDAVDSGNYTNPIAARYGYALALLAAGKLDQAREGLEALLASEGDRVPFYASLAKIELERGNLERALEIYAEADGLFPDSRIIVRGYAEALVRAGEAPKALELIRKYAQAGTRDAALYKIEAEALEQTGNASSAYVALAEHYYVTGQLDAAIYQLKRATSAPGGDFYQRSRVEARLSEFEEEKEEREKR